MAGGKAYVLQSGQSLTNSFVYGAKYNTLGFASVGILVENVSPGSGVQYTVRGYPVVGLQTTHAFTSGTVLLSGDNTFIDVTSHYAEIDVGLKAAQTDQSGVATVYVTGKPG